ncbi:polysaccharide biosynthesis C-terminal domain-containing protein [Candidatus Thiothrix anitrata]|uniref:NAD-dependent epimerase/dehydratase family protein n=1 Tax=Candidatus Thiothrix anitrata TaxID=2823902 RepID=A0ABX7X8Z6_9GAMM|nr:NAD-dependent epimerase/dehydratase family protein [Candidatus Thiothrix anitrata]QTR51692.1 NAD-dependent epimerase/dehydratase family protein [Candidatus Thiothrix anitrata]
MKVLVTGADGFIGKNLLARFAEMADMEALRFSRQNTEQELPELVAAADAIIHLAGINRPLSPEEFVTGNTGLTTTLSRILTDTQRTIPVLFASSTQAALDNPYGSSKRAAEDALRQYAEQTGANVYIYRLPNVFGKWCKPNYNSAVATFCHNIANGLPININDPNAPITLVHVDDVVSDFIQVLQHTTSKTLTPRPPLPEVEGEQELVFLSPSTSGRGIGVRVIAPEYQTTVGELAQQIEGFRNSRNTLITPKVGTGLLRALYSTYVSYLPTTDFAYSVPKYGDQRGVFVEMLKTPDAGQFSFFTAHPGITRGGHYHHTKTEKFLVIKGKARFGFRHILTDETFTLETDGDNPQIVETIPGWAHDITNIGTDEMVVMLWANEQFDREHPDTYAHQV